MGRFLAENPAVKSGGRPCKHTCCCATVWATRDGNVRCESSGTLRCQLAMTPLQLTEPLNQGRSGHPSLGSPFSDHIKGYMVCVMAFDKHEEMIIIVPA